MTCSCDTGTYSDAAAGVFEMQELHLAFAHVHVDQPVVAADAVLGVHHRVAGAQFGQVAHHGFDIAGAFLGALAAPGDAGMAGVEVVLGQEQQGAAGNAEAGRQRRHGQAEARAVVQEGLDRIGLRLGRQAVFASICASVSRRPAESAHSSTRSPVCASSARRRATGSSARRATATSGAAAKSGCGRSAIKARRGKSFRRANSASWSRNRVSGGSTGRSRSTLRKS